MSKDKNVYDKKGIPIHRGDIVKVFHFIGSRRKKYYMYKQCLGLGSYKKNGVEYVFFSHLDFNDKIGSKDGPYPEWPGTVLEDYEIVQSLNPYSDNHEQRERKKNG